MVIDVGELKSARELLCRAQHALIHYKGGFAESEIARIEKMIDQIDVLRPLGPDGKHGNRHTDNCGCDGIIDWRKLPTLGDLYMDSTGRIKKPNDEILREEINKGSVLRLFFKVFPELTQGPTGYPIMKAVD